MLALPTGFEACDRTTVLGDTAAPTPLPHLQEREGLCMAKRTLWAVCALDSGELDSTAAVFDVLWKGVSATGRRRLSVRRQGDAYWALIYKGDQAVVDLGSVSGAPASAVYEIPKPGAGPAASRAILDFAKAWFAAAQELTSNFAFSAEPRQEEPDVIEFYENVRSKSNKDLQYAIWRARKQEPWQRSAEQRTLLAGNSQIANLKREEERSERKRKAEEDFIFRVGETATALEYPRDVRVLAQKTGETYDERAEETVHKPFGEYAEGTLNLEKVLVLWGPGGRGKTQAARCIAKHLAIGHGASRYVSTGCVDELKAAQNEFAERVPVVLEELGANDVSQHGRPLSANYLKNLLNVPDGGTCRVRNKNIRFCRWQPRILCINDKPEDWLRRIGDMRDTDSAALRRRVFFVHADEALLAPEAIAAHDAELGAVMRKFKQRKQEYNEKRGLPEEPE